MKKMNVCLALMAVICLVACGGGGGGGNGGGGQTVPEAAAYDASGVWVITQTFERAWPDDFVPEIQCDPGMISYTLAHIAQNGSAVTLEDMDGTVSGDAYSFVYSETDTSGVTTTITIAFTLTSATTFSGTCTIEGWKGTSTAGVVYQVGGKKAQAPAYDASGTWSIPAATLQKQEGSGFTFEEDLPGSFEIIQNGNDITGMKDDKGHTYAGCLSGADYFAAFTTCQGDGIRLTVTCTFSLTASDTFEGTLVAELTDGTNRWKGEYAIKAWKP